MKFLETHFDDYLTTTAQSSLHPKKLKIYQSFPQSLDRLKNIIFYGPKGVGKYTQALSSIKKYSPSELKYEKRLIINSNKENFIIKISDIHFEVDMSLLGCNSKVLWNDVYNQINDVVSTRPEATGIIMCKNFHKIHSELLDIFYSYIQSQSFHKNKLVFIIITEHISFIPDSILNNSQILSIPRPSFANYNKCLAAKNVLDKQLKPSTITKITNIKNISTNITSLSSPYEPVCNAIIEHIKNPNIISFLSFRDILYEILIYDLDIGECVWYILNELIRDNLLNNDNISDVLLKTYIFFQYYNNNYRPIYHLENYVYNLVIYVNGYKEGA